MGEENLDPPWTFGPKGQRHEMEVSGNHDFSVTIDGFQSEIGDRGVIATAAHCVNSVPAVCAAAPGVATYLDLPLVSGRRRRRCAPATGERSPTECCGDVPGAGTATIGVMAGSLTVEQSRAIPVEPDEAFRRTAPIHLPSLFRRRYGPIPPVREVRDQTGDWDRAGQTRTVVLAGAGTMFEELTSYDPPNSFGYTLTRITGPLSPVISRVEADWRFQPAGTGTRVTWRWTIVPKTALAAPVLPVLGRLWRGYARQSLEELSDQLVG